MVGSEKQIKWAEDIINNINTTIDNLIADYHRLNAEGGEGFGEHTCKYTDKELTTLKEGFAKKFENMTAGQIIDIRDRFRMNKIIEAAQAMHRMQG